VKPTAFSHRLSWLFPVLLWIGWAAVEQVPDAPSTAAAEETQSDFTSQSGAALPSATFARAVLAPDRETPEADDTRAPGPAPVPLAPTSQRPAPAASGSCPGGAFVPCLSLRHLTAHSPRGPPSAIG